MLASRVVVDPSEFRSTGGGHTPPITDEQTTAVAAPRTSDGVHGHDREVGEAPERLASGGRIGRFVLLSRLGAGGMGVVYSAYDPELDRKLAIKLLRSDRNTGDQGQRRLLREAQALAQLAHPNVVAIHDVGVHEGQVWLAMEFVSGCTLGVWLQEQVRTWQEIVAVIHEVGRGLAVAHAAGLLHRDIKPANIMIDIDGRVRLMDFGLARADNLDASDRMEPVQNHVLSLELTKSGAVLGTPAYMAPEQLLGLDLDTRADQFSLCVVLWEALYCERPYDLLTEPSKPVPLERRPTPRKRGVPAWLRRLCLRGLALDPDARWPSVPALLDVLQRGHARARRGAALFGAAIVVLGIAAFYGARELEHARTVAACEASGEQIFLSWSEDARAGLRESLIVLSMPDAELVADRAITWLDEFADRWRDAKTEACLDYRVRTTVDAELAELTEACLDERALEFEILVAELGNSDAKRAQQLLRATKELRIDACRNGQVLRSLPRAPVDLRIRIPAIRTQLIRVRMLQRSGDLQSAVELARTTHERAAALGWDPLTAQSGGALGRLLTHAGAFEEAERMLESSYLLADASGAFDVRITIATDLADLVGVRLGRAEEGMRWTRLAEAALLGWGNDEPLARASILISRGALEWQLDNHRAAIERYEEALALEESVLGPNHPLLYSTLNRLGVAHDSLGDSTRALEIHERSLALARDVLGPNHPDIGVMLTNLGAVHHAAGEYEEAKALHERALVICRAALGPEHPAVADTLQNLAAALLELEEREAAITALTEALAIYERNLGRDHPDVVIGLMSMASVLEHLPGQLERAHELYADALERAEAASGAARLEVLVGFAGVARTNAALGRDDQARKQVERAAQLVAALDPIEDAAKITALLSLAEQANLYAQHDAGVVLAGEAVALADRANLPTGKRAHARWYLARALATKEPQQARALIERARAEAIEIGDEGVELRRELDEWIVARGVP
jgi:tetratricopeptide (TPR) repeat protein